MRLAAWLGGTLLQPQRAWRGRRRHTQSMGGWGQKAAGKCGQCGLLEGSAGLVLQRRAPPPPRACHFVLKF